MKNYKVIVTYKNGITFLYECEAENAWQAEAKARVKGRQLELGMELRLMRYL
jgi:hypothetical protein